MDGHKSQIAHDWNAIREYVMNIMHTSFISHVQRCLNAYENGYDGTPSISHMRERAISEAYSMSCVDINVLGKLFDEIDWSKPYDNSYKGLIYGGHNQVILQGPRDLSRGS